MNATVSRAGMNEGSIDRTVRAAGAVVAFVSVFACPSTLGKVVSLGLAGFLGTTAVTGKCPVYDALGIDSLSLGQ